MVAIAHLNSTMVAETSISITEVSTSANGPKHHYKGMKEILEIIEELSKEYIKDM